MIQMAVNEVFDAADMHWYFNPPLCYIDPRNTEEVFTRFVSNPKDFETFVMSNEYFAQRYTDLKADMEKIRNAGRTKENENKYYYYLGMVDLLKQVLMNVPITPKKK